MKLQNRETREIGELHFEPDKEYHFTVATEDPADMRIYKTLAEFNEEWEDYEEQCWYITSTGEVREGVLDADWRDERRIGNYFEAKEEAEKAVEKLKAWKRLKDKGFGITLRDYKGYACLEANWGSLQGDYSDVLLLFGGKE